MVTGILDGLRWLGLDWDEGPDVGGPHAPYFQSERLDRYRAMADGSSPRARVLLLLHPERCRKTCSGRSRRRRWSYDARACLTPSGRRLEAAVRRARSASRCPRADAFDDLVHGAIAFENANIEDFVILRSDGQPTYHLSVVVDDIDMAITHVVRGDDHISNTPKQVLLYQAFGAAVAARSRTCR